MVMFYSHDLSYQIEFKIHVNWFSVILQKQIDSKFKFAEATESTITIKTYSNITSPKHFEKNELLKQTHEELSRNYRQLARKINLEQTKLLELNDDPCKYDKIKNICKRNNIYVDNNKYEEELEYKLELFLEEFKLFVNSLDLDEQEQNAVNSIVQDPELSSNIKFVGWKDVWTFH
jgi:hypothetical protein